VLFVGDRGRLMSDYARHIFLPESEFREVEPPAVRIPDSIGHHREWIEACKSGGTTTCSFDYSGPLTEAVLLGNVAYRSGCRVEWDAGRMRAKGCAEASAFVRHEYRAGWAL
jgi:hypothetical protein